jgi:lipopolysaccharide/colanic/teichoic acid biosynthesis glycosyltransferase
MKTTLLVTVLIAVGGRFMADEVKAWFAWLHGKLRRAAVSLLPKKCRERYDEEWGSGLEECPGEIFKLIYSIGLLVAATGIRKAAFESLEDAGTPPLKRLFDIAFSLILIVICAPLFVAIGLAIKLETRGPVFELSECIGKNGRLFYCRKFRIAASFVQPGRHGRCLFRLTRVGRLLRIGSLEELPQFLSVLQGHMSFVGPRLTKEEIIEPGAPIGPWRATLGRWTASGGGEQKRCQLGRFDVIPGLTGLWQVIGGQDRRFIEPLNEAYARKWSIWLDLQIIMRSFVMACNASTSDDRLSED